MLCQGINVHGLCVKDRQILLHFLQVFQMTFCYTQSCFWELFEPAVDVVHMRWFPSKFIPDAEH
jgi:hypothetical protein